MKIEKKHLPDLANILNNYFKTYNTGFNKLDHQNKEEIIWFTCKVMQAVKKTWKPLIPHWTISLAYYFAVCASDEASGLCLFQYYKPTLGNKKPDDMVEEDEGEKENEQGDTNGDVAAKKNKLKKAQEDYASWYQKFQVLREQKPTTENSLPSAIEDHCNMVIQKKAEDRNCIHKIDTTYDPCILLATRSQMKPW